MPIVHPPRPLNPKEAFDGVSAAVLTDPQVVAVLNKARELHLPWDKFRFQPLPRGVSHEKLWGYLRLSRRLDSQILPLLDEKSEFFFYSVPVGAQRLLSQIDRQAAGSLLADEAVLPSRERFIVSSLMEEAIASSLLEGAHTTRVEAKKMLREGRSPRNQAEQMVFNNWRTLEHVQSLRAEPLSLALLLEIHALVTRDTLDDARDCGQLRRRNDVRVEDVRSGEIVHQPPPFERLPDRLASLIEWANDDETVWIHPVVKASLLHFFIGYEHPFVDGNGRTARALFYWFMLSRGYWLFECLAISRFFLRAPIQYGRAYVLCETDENDTTYFISHSLRVIELALSDMRLYLTRKSREAQIVANVTLINGLNARQQAILGHAGTHPDAQYTFALHQKLHRITYQTARTDLLGLEAQGLLSKRKVGKQFVFVPNSDLNSRLR